MLEEEAEGLTCYQATRQQPSLTFQPRCLGMSPAYGRNSLAYTEVQEAIERAQQPSGSIIL